MSDTKLYSFKLDLGIVQLLDQIKVTLGTATRTGAFRQSVTTTATLVNEAANQTAHVWDSLIDAYGDDAVLVVRVTEGDDGQPICDLSVDAKAVEGTDAVASLAADKSLALIYLVSDPADFAGEFATIGQTKVFIGMARMPIGDVDWPPDPKNPVGIVVRLGDIGRVPEPVESLLKPVA